MPRLSRKQIMKNNKLLILEDVASLKKSIFSFSDMAKILDENKVKWGLPNATTVSDFIVFLSEEQSLEIVDIELPTRVSSKYILGNPSVYELALTINKNSYLSHYTALFVHGLTNNVIKTIYTNLEQAKKWNNIEDGILEQKNIDLAFSRPMRKTNQIANFKFKSTKYQVYLLNGKSHDNLGVIRLSIEGKDLYVTDIERTLIDVTVRPSYAGGIEEVLNAYKAAKKKFSVNKLLKYLKQMDFKYPYHQLVGFYLEKAGYDEKLLKILDQFEINYNFYLTYQMRDKEFSDRWRVFYPKGFL